MYFSPSFSSMVTACVSTVRYQTQDIDTGAIHQPYSISISGTFTHLYENPFLIAPTYLAFL